MNELPLKPHAALIDALRREARDAPESGIVEVANYGRGRAGLIPLWVGEGDLPTPAFICEAATRALAAGETFYTWQRGIPELREALARYHTTLYGRAVRAGGVLRHRLRHAGDPDRDRDAGGRGRRGRDPDADLAECRGGDRHRRRAAGRGADAFGNDGWALDFDRLAAAITPRTRALFVVSPSNPTGWTATREELAALLALARRHGLWIVADETYARFWYGEGPRAPSFYDVMEPEDRVLFVNTFSKNWAMTGWRVGWIVANPALGQVIENMIQYSTSGVAQFMQRAAVAALERGEGFVTHLVERARRGRDICCDGLAATGRCRFVAPQGAFYLFFSVDGETGHAAAWHAPDRRGQCRLGAGTAFGAGGERFVRLCFARNAEQLGDRDRTNRGGAAVR